MTSTLRCPAHRRRSRCPDRRRSPSSWESARPPANNGDQSGEPDGFTPPAAEPVEQSCRDTNRSAPRTCRAERTGHTSPAPSLRLGREASRHRLASDHTFAAHGRSSTCGRYGALRSAICEASGILPVETRVRRHAGTRPGQDRVAACDRHRQPAVALDGPRSSLLKPAGRHTFARGPQGNARRNARTVRRPAFMPAPRAGSTWSRE